MADTPWLGDACSLVDAFRSGEHTPTDELTAVLGAIDASTIWVGGPNGVLITSRATNVSMFLPAVAGVRARVRDILLSPEHGWVATEAGVVRLIRLPDGMVR